MAPGQDLGHVLRVTEAVVSEVNHDSAWRDLLVDPFVIMGLERVGTDAAILRLVARTRPGGDAARLAREARLRLLQRWQEEGIRTAAPLVAERRPEAGLISAAAAPPPPGADG